MDVYAIAAELLGGSELTPEQRARLRALSARYLAELHALRRSEAAARPSPAGEAPAPAKAELAELEARITGEIREMVAEAPRARREDR